MKLFLIFILFFILGCGLTSGYIYWNYQQSFLLPFQVPVTTKFSLENAPENSLNGIIASMSGTVNWQSRVSSNSIRLQSSRTIKQGEALGTGKDGSVRVVIKNSEEIIETPNSHINFIQMLPINLVISQDAGSVGYENTGLNPMTVKTLDLITSINRALVLVSLDQSTQVITVTVQKGSVTEGYEDSQGNSTIAIVNAGQRFIFNETAQKGTIE